MDLAHKEEEKAQHHRNVRNQKQSGDCNLASSHFLLFGRKEVLGCGAVALLCLQLIISFVHLFFLF